jgi:hypothetical protein
VKQLFLGFFGSIGFFCFFGFFGSSAAWTGPFWAHFSIVSADPDVYGSRFDIFLS